MHTDLCLLQCHVDLKGPGRWHCDCPQTNKVVYTARVWSQIFEIFDSMTQASSQRIARPHRRQTVDVGDVDGMVLQLQLPGNDAANLIPVVLLRAWLPVGGLVPPVVGILQFHLKGDKRVKKSLRTIT